MRKAVDYAGLCYWNFIISKLDSEKLREKDQADRKHEK
jgi:hypothetical protein